MYAYLAKAEGIQTHTEFKTITTVVPFQQSRNGDAKISNNLYS